MKKLLITAIGAAVAFGAFADAVRFEGYDEVPVTALSQLPGGTNFWSELEGSTNTYAIGAAGTVSAPLSIASGESSPTRALDIKTTFGKPLSLNAVSGGATTNINDGLYFDSLVKFTVCDAGQNADMYTDAKIVMWLEQNEDETQTNLIVRAGYLSLSGDTVTSTPTNYVCTLTGGIDVDAWHRVTIKAIADITTTGRGVPGFAIYLDENGDTATSDINAGTAVMWGDSFPASELTEAAALLNDSAALFPSLDVSSGNKATLTSASFDGTGSITDLIFTDNGPDFAKDMVSQKASVTIDGNEQTGIVTLADAIDAANGAVQDAAVVITLAKGFDFDAPVTIAPVKSGVSVVLDFNGFVINNTGSECLITNSAALTVTDSSSGATGGIVGKAICQGDGSLTINGGNFWTLGAFDLSGATTVSIAGGSFKDDETAFETEETESGTWVATGKKLVLNAETGLYDVVDKPAGVAQIGESIYDTLAEALEAATAGQTIKLLDDVTATAVSTAAGTLDLNGKTLTLSGATAITFTGTGAKTLKGGDLMGVYHELTITAPAGENLTFDGMTFHASVKPAGSGALFTVTNCQFLCDLDKTGAEFTDGSTADVHSYGVMFFVDSQFAQADIVNSYFDQGRRAAVQASFAGDLYFYGNTVVADKLTSRVDGAATRYPALQTMTHGRVFIENNTFSGQYLGEAFCLYNKGTYRTTDKAIVFSGNTVSNGVNYLWGIYDVDKSGDAALVAPNLYFGANTVDANVDTTGCIYKTTVDGTDMNGVTYSHTPATLALPAGVDSVYAWTHAAGATDFYVNGTAAANLNSVAANDTVVAVPGATVTEPAAIILTADATLKNKYTAGAAVAQITGGAKYATLKDAVDAADTGDTVTVLADCSVTNGNVGITFTKGINIVNNYTITIDGANYALRIANGTTTPVTWSGTGSLVWLKGSGSPIIVGSNEKKATYGINEFYEGSFVLNGGTLTSTDATAKGGNLVKLEAGTFVLNDGMINGGTRGVKADSEGNDATCVLTINGGTIVNTNTAAVAASTAGSGSSTVTINAGTFTGKLVGTGMVTIPGTSTAKFNADQSAFCESGYETTLSDGWYVVTKVKPSVDPIDTTTGGSATFDDATAAANAAQTINDNKETFITVAEGVTGEAKAAYLEKVEAVVNGNTVTIQFTSAAAMEAQDQADADNASLPLAAIAAAEGSADATIAATPGFYYTVESGTEPGDLKAGTSVLATGNTVKLSIPNKGAAGFYKIKITPTK